MLFESFSFGPVIQVSIVTKTDKIANVCHHCPTTLCGSLFSVFSLLITLLQHHGQNTGRLEILIVSKCSYHVSKCSYRVSRMKWCSKIGLGSWGRVGATPWGKGMLFGIAPRQNVCVCERETVQVDDRDLTDRLQSCWARLSHSQPPECWHRTE